MPTEHSAGASAEHSPLRAVGGPSVDVLTVGHLSRNRFWGEADDQAYRPASCTCTLIRSGGQAILVDPGDAPEHVAVVLDERAGLRVADVGAVFLTHFHGDHRVGVDAFPDVDWLMGADELAFWAARPGVTAADRVVLDRTSPAPQQLAPGVMVLATPGHTPGHSSLLVQGRDVVVVAGDAIPTRDFYVARQVFFNALDARAAVSSMDHIGAAADLIVPGHDNVFLNHRPAHPRGR